MAEGWARQLLADSVEAYSAGTAPQTLNPLAVRAMAECNIDISTYRAKSLNSLHDQTFSLIVTVCDNAASACPAPPKGVRVVHAPFDDPPNLVTSDAPEDEALPHYRRVRDEIKQFVMTIPSILNPAASLA